MQRILIIDDDTAVCASLSLLLRRAKYGVFAIHRPNDLEEALAAHQPDLILLDMNFSISTSGKDGMKLLARIMELSPELPVILMTGWATVQLAVEGMKLGAKDFIAKPWDNKQLLASVKTILSLTQPAAAQTTANPNLGHIVGKDPALLQVLEQAKRVANTKASVLITGESGTGKELIAETIHGESDRANQAFIKVNLGGISTALFESELFGHKKGAFTDAKTDREGRFAMANGGTIFLDEIGDLALSSQVKLLRVLQENTFEPLGSSKTIRVDVRVVTATHKSLEQLVREGRFREDLLYRINLIKLHLPALRDRPGDIPLLVKHFLNNLERSYDRPNLSIRKNAVDWLQRQSFPGNIRQLKNLVERTVLLSATNNLDVADFSQHYEAGEASNSPVDLPAVGSLTLEELEIKAIKKALSFHQNQIAAAARSLGITRSALYRRLEKYQIPH